MAMLLPLHRLAARLRLPADWLKAETDAGRIPHLRVRSKTLYNPDAVERALAERAARTPSCVGGGHRS